MHDTIPLLNAALPMPVLVVEDDPQFSRRLRALLGRLGYPDETVLSAASLAQARAQLAERPVALALVDLGLPDGSGIELIAQLHGADPAPEILVISACITEDMILAALRAGATGYLLKERDDLELALSIRSVLRGGAPIDPFIARRLLADLRPASPHAPPCSSKDLLSAREQQILHLVADGLANREIADELALSRHTVECHIKNLYRKLAVSSRTRALRAARSRGWLRG